jgi:acetylornithine deacetylase
MLLAAHDVARAGGPLGGRLLVLLGYAEETRDTTMPQAVVAAGPIDAAVIGEPTGLDLAIAQRGLLMAELVAHGEQRHAGRVTDDGPCAQAVLLLATELLKLPKLFRERPHPLLGDPSVTPTQLEAGVARNVVPPKATAVLDVRSTPAWSHAELAEGLRRSLACEVVVTSERLVPCETPAGSKLLAVAQRLRPHARCYGSPTCSDWVFLRSCDAFKCGPGHSSRSHTPDEFVELSEVDEARAFYAGLALEWLAIPEVVR